MNAAAVQPVGDARPPGVPADTQSVVARYKSMVYGIAVTHTRCRSDADDVFQDVFLTYHRKQPACHDEQHRKAWLITTTLTVARRQATTSWRTRVVPLHPDRDVPTPETFTFRTEQQDAIARALATVPETYRTVVHLFYFADLPVAEIADLLGATPAAIKMRLSRGRALMRDLLSPDQPNGGLFDE
ncbi:MAG: sigma-70 family RNA polymerase sigma factor [Micrococcales bacterium]|nr:sigma-70 family RNA polymerase sigma factor [Micrococcales bacterium]